MDLIVKAVRQWFSQPSNRHWLLIIDNVDRDYLPETKDPQAFDVKELFPPADHGYVIITTRSMGVRGRWDGQKLGRVSEEQAKAILENNARRSIQGIRLTH
jgi:hypothetical protein